MQDMLSTFQKHIGEPFPTQERSLHKFSEDIKGANEFIGALQSASVALKKILKNAQENANQSVQAIQEIVQSASFMGVKLFDTHFSTRLNGKTYELSIDSPLPLIPQDIATESSADSVNPLCNLIAYVEDKSLEIAQMLICLSEALSEPSQSQYDFNSFNPQAFAQMLKGK